MSKIDFRHIAAARLKQAKIELASQDEQRLKYAALELRMAIEGLTYDRAQAYKAEISPEEYGHWQPRRVMQLLLDVDPWADQTSTFSIGIQPSQGENPKDMHCLGTDKVFNLKSIREHYAALGSFLHLQTLQQIEAGAPIDTKKLRARCDILAEELEAVLSSPIYNVTLGSFAQLLCGRCKHPIRRRIPLDAQEIEVKCFECGAPYSITRVNATQVEWHELITTFNCRTEGCGSSFPIWRDQVKPGAYFGCPDCKARYILQLIIVGQT